MRNLFRRSLTAYVTVPQYNKFFREIGYDKEATIAPLPGAARLHHAQAQDFVGAVREPPLRKTCEIVDRAVREPPLLQYHGRVLEPHPPGSLPSLLVSGLSGCAEDNSCLPLAPTCTGAGGCGSRGGYFSTTLPRYPQFSPSPSFTKTLTRKAPAGAGMDLSSRTTSRGSTACKVA